MSEESKPVSRRLSPLAIIGLVIGGLAVFCFLFYATGLNRAALQLLPPTEGQEAYLRTDSSVAIVARDMDVYNTVGHATLEELGRMQQDGRIFLVARNTRVRVLQYGAGYDKVQILDGGFAGHVGFVPNSVVAR